MIQCSLFQPDPFSDSVITLTPFGGRVDMIAAKYAFISENFS